MPTVLRKQPALGDNPRLPGTVRSAPRPHTGPQRDLGPPLVAGSTCRLHAWARRLPRGKAAGLGHRAPAAALPVRVPGVPGRGAPGAAGTGMSRSRPLCGPAGSRSRGQGQRGGGRSSLLGACGRLQPPSHGKGGRLFCRMGELWKNGQEERGARAGRAGLAGSFQSTLSLQIIDRPAQPEPSPSVQRHQKLCPVAKAGGHSLGLWMRHHISALASSQDNFLEASDSLRVPLGS